MNPNPTCTAVGFLAACLFTPNVFAATVYWTNWTSDTPGTTNGTAAGTITSPSATIGVTYSGEVTSETQINGTSTTGYPRYLPASTYPDEIIVTDAIASSTRRFARSRENQFRHFLGRRRILARNELAIAHGKRLKVTAMLVNRAQFARARLQQKRHGFGQTRELLLRCW